MSEKVKNFLISYFLVPGILTGVQFNTGVDISESGILSLFVKSICNLTTIPEITTQFCTSLNLLIITLSILSYLPFIIVFMTKNSQLILTSILYYLGGVLLMQAPIVGFCIILFAALLSLFIDSEDIPGL